MSSVFLAYVRVSSIDQNEARQIEAIKQSQYDIRKIYIDKCTGKDMNRPEFKDMNRQLQEGDTLVVQSIDRLGRNMIEIINYIENLVKNEINFICLDNSLFNIDNNNKANRIQQKILLAMCAGFSELERELIRKRQREGIKKAKEAGIHIGRPYTEKALLNAVQEDIDLGMSVSQACRKHDLARRTYYNRRKNSI